MIVVKIELHSAVTGQVTELGRMIVANDGTQGNGSVGNYDVYVGRKGVVDNERLLSKPQRKGKILQHKRHSLSVWVLLKKALDVVGF